MIKNFHEPWLQNLFNSLAFKSPSLVFHIDYPNQYLDSNKMMCSICYEAMVDIRVCVNRYPEEARAN